MTDRTPIGSNTRAAAAMALLLVAATGCAAKRDLARQPDWTALPRPDHLVGLASGAGSEAAARSTAMQDLVRQIGEMVATSVRVERVTLRTGDSVEVHELVRSEARGLIGTPWDRVIRQELRQTPRSHRDHTPSWDAFIEVHFTQADLDRLIRETQRRSAAYLHEFDELLARSETAEAEGKVPAALAAVGEALALAEDASGPIGLDLEPAARRRQETLVRSIHLGHEGTTIEGCLYIIRTRVTDSRERPVSALRLIASVAGGGGTLVSSAVATDADGRATFAVMPNGPDRITIDLRPELGKLAPTATPASLLVALELPADLQPPDFQVEARPSWQAPRWLPVAPRLRDLQAVLTFSRGTRPSRNFQILAMAQGRIPGDSHVRTAAQAVDLPNRPRSDGTYVVALPELALEIDRWRPGLALGEPPVIWITFDMQGSSGCSWARWQIRRDAPLPSVGF